jgi:tetratricopeptide (TPR) repeat protein
MQFELKPLSQSAIPAALERAHLYRLLNEPWQAESICEDVLRVDPRNQTALVTLLLAITDQFGTHISSACARDVLSRIGGEYERAYYAGIIWERSARARIRQGLPRSNFKAYEELREAMRCYELAERLRPPDNDEALLRWNTCARTLSENHELQPQPQEALAPILDD